MTCRSFGHRVRHDLPAPRPADIDEGVGGHDRRGVEAGADAAGSDEGVAVGSADSWVAEGVGTDGGAVSGASAMSPPSSSPAAATPTTRPATIDRRANMSRGGYQYEQPAAFSEGRCYDARPMASFANWIRTRIVPAILTALGITFLVAGLLSFTTGSTPAPASGRRTARRPAVTSTRRSRR